jgi:hypothetical protein
MILVDLLALVKGADLHHADEHCTLHKWGAAAPEGGDPVLPRAAHAHRVRHRGATALHPPPPTRTHTHPTSAEVQPELTCA